jgi:hypothetical protein
MENTLAPDSQGPVRHIVKGVWIEPPVLPAVPTKDGARCVVFCRYCDDFHVHGNLSGGRVAHCFVTNSPYKTSGYVLNVMKGKFSDLRPPRSQRRRPRYRRSDGRLEHGWTEER